MTAWTRREFLKTSTAAVAALSAGPLAAPFAFGADKPGSKMRMGLVTYLWGQDWDLPTLIANCERTGYLGVETRTEHAHGVEPSLSADQRKEVKKRFADSPVELIGPGTNQQYDDPEPEKLKASIEGTKAFIVLSHDCGGSGVKVKPNSFHKEVPREVTIEQIGRSLNVVGAFAADYGQEIRLEVHGTCAELPVIKQIMDYVDHKNVGVCWNCNAQDLHGEGLEYNFNLVKDRFGTTVHVRELNESGYPYQELMNLYVAMDYAGWILLEGRGKPEDRIAAMIEQREWFERMVAKAQEKQ
jgi:sugar phosphate isomerase/epimerase